MSRTRPDNPPSASDWAELWDRQESNERRIDELRAWTAWLAANDAEGYVGELGWAATPEWQQLADYWYRIAEQEGTAVAEVR